MSPRTKTWTVHRLSEGSHCEGKVNKKTVNRVDMIRRIVKIMVSSMHISRARRYGWISSAWEELPVVDWEDNDVDHGGPP